MKGKIIDYSESIIFCGVSMKALVTGASSGIGLEISKYLVEIGYDVVGIGRNEKNLINLNNELGKKFSYLIKDLSNYEEVIQIYEETKNENIDFLINCAGIGSYGDFISSDLNSDIQMLNVNVMALHILTKLYLKDMIRNNKGYILNISSLSGFMPGPLMAEYYATKAYVTNLTLAIREEIKYLKNNNTIISVGCPGPVNSNFNNKLNVIFKEKPLSSKYVAKYMIDQCLKGKMIIVPGLRNKMARIFSKILSTKILLKFVYNIQNSKIKK